MQHDLFILYLIGGMYAFIAWLILYQIEIRWRPFAKMKCRLGYHKRSHKALGQKISQYRCVHCNKPKNHPHLKVIQGEKKNFDNNFKF